MKTNSFTFMVLLALGGLVGYFLRWQRDLNYARTLEVAQIGTKASGVVTNVLDIIKILKKGL